MGYNKADDMEESYTFENGFCPYFPMPCPYNDNSREEMERPQQGPPESPPPNFTPKMMPQGAPGAGPSVKMVESGTLRPCVNRYVYMWLNNGQQFWAYLTYVGRHSVSGWRYRRGRWTYFGIDMRQIRSFECY